MERDKGVTINVSPQAIFNQRAQQRLFTLGGSMALVGHGVDPFQAEDWQVWTSK